MDFENIPFELPGLVRTIVRSQKTAAQSRFIGLTCSIDPAVAPMMYGDPTRVTQVLTNLLSVSPGRSPENLVAASVCIEPLSIHFLGLVLLASCGCLVVSSHSCNACLSLRSHSALAWFLGFLL